MQQPSADTRSAQDYHIPDPPLSELGRAQCGELAQALQEKLPADMASNIGLIVSSAMRRTCETTVLSLGALIAKEGIPTVAHAGWQENSSKPCDTGSPLPVVAAEFPQIDFSAVDPVYPDKTSPAGAKYKYQKASLVARAQADLEELYHRPEKVVVVVSHSGFMRQAVTGDHYFNADYRIYDFEERTEGESGPFRLRQSDLTKGAGGMGRSFDQIVDIGTGLPEQELPAGAADPTMPPGFKPN
ncbi:unnamed protein product [Discula destructiva]